MLTGTAHPPCYCITGHGRSGTSFIAAMLQSAGLDIGRRLMGPAESNVRGHFEDMDFFEFHVSVLTSQGYGGDGFLLEPSLRVQEQFVEAARGLIEPRRRAGRPWGWKEPRTTLFLDFWRELVPELRFLLLFRRPWDVVDSLFRSGYSIYQRNPNLAAQVWLNHNRTVIDFYDRFPERCLLIESHAAAREPHRLTEAIAAKFGDHFGPVGSIYEDELFRHEDTSPQRWVLAHFFPEAMTLYEQLQARAALVQTPDGARSGEAGLDWALQHWLDLRWTEKKWARAETERSKGQAALHQAQSQLDESQSQFLRAQTDLERQADEANRLRAEAARARADLERIRGELDRVRAELARVEAERAESRARLAYAEAELEGTTTVFHRLQAHVAWVEGSKFWKLRRLWLRLRSLFRAPHPSAAGPAAVLSGLRIDGEHRGLFRRPDLHNALGGSAPGTAAAQETSAGLPG